MNTCANHPVLVLALLGALPAQAAPHGESRTLDRLVLKTGEVLDGSIRGQTTDTVTFARAGQSAVRYRRTDLRVVRPAGSDLGIFDITAPTPVPDAPQSYIRYLPGSRKAGTPGSLSTGVSRWLHPGSATTLFLVGAVHIAEPAYYDRLQGILDQTDVVLFEAVKKGKQPLSEEQLASMTALGRMQMAMTDALGLEHQKAAMDYDRPFWINADVDWPTLQAHMRDNRAHLPTDHPLIRRLLGFVANLMSRARQSPRTHDVLRRQMAPVLAQADVILATRMKNVGASLILFRNAKAMEFVRAERQRGPKGRWLALFYGAGHLPDLAARLRKAGWQFQGADWVEAWHFTGR